MKGRGVRVINDDDLKAVSLDARTKDPEKKRTVSFEKLLQSVSLGNIEPEVISSIAVRMARMEHAISAEDHGEIRKLADKSLKILCAGLITAIDPDRQVERAKLDNPGVAEPSEAQIQKAAAKLIQEAVKPLHNPELRRLLVELKKKSEQTIDVVSKDRVLVAGFDAQALARDKALVQSFEQFIKTIRTRSPRSRCSTACHISSGCGTRISKTSQAGSRSRRINGEWIISGMLMQRWKSPKSKAQAPSISSRTLYHSSVSPCTGTMS